MFSVYGKSGLMFRGSMEELRKIGPTSALARTRRVAAVACFRPELNKYTAPLNGQFRNSGNQGGAALRDVPVRSRGVVGVRRWGATPPKRS